MRLFPISLIFSFIFLLAFVAAPVRAEADTLDDLIARVQSMMEEMAKVQVQLLELKKADLSGGTSTDVTTPTGTVLGASTFSFAGPVTSGDTSEDIKKIQALLKTDSEIYPEGIVSGWYGPATTQAIRNLQSRFGLDPVGVVGPATTALLERLIGQQNSDGTYPSDILDPARPTGTVLGVTTQTTDAAPTPVNVVSAPVPTAAGDDIVSIKLSLDQGEGEVEVEYEDGSEEEFFVFADSKSEAVEEIAVELGVSESTVSKYLETDKADDIDEIRIEFDGEEAEVEVEYEDGDEEDFDVEGDDIDEVYEEIADELDIDEDDVEDLAKVTWRLDADEIDEIRAVVDGNEAEITIELENGDEIEMTIDESDEDDIIEALADELDIDEDDIEDIIDVDEKDRELDSVEVEVEDGRAYVRIEYENGDTDTFSMDEDSTGDMVEYIAERANVDEDEVEDVIDFEFID